MLTMQEIAERTGFSRYTISKVLQGDTSVRPENREKILVACRKYGYIPNLNAVGLVKGKSDLLGVIVPQISDRIYAEILKYIEEESLKCGFRLAVRSSYNSRALEAENIMNFLSYNVRAMIVIPVAGRPDPDAHRAASVHVPLVYLERTVGKHPYFVSNDFADGTRRLTLSLLKKGRKPAYLGSCMPSQGYVQNLQKKGYLNVMKEAGMEPWIIGPEFTYQRFDNARAGYDTMCHQIFTGHLPDALICVTDQTACGAMRAMREQGIIPGHDILLAGHNNIDLGVSFSPSLTSVSRNNERGVILCFNILNSLLNDVVPEPPCHILSPVIYERESTMGVKKEKTSE